MKTLVTGAHGFIGSHLAEELLAHGHEVRALVSPWGKLDNLAQVLGQPRLELIRADITEPESLQGVCQDIELVFHAAAKVAEWGPWEPFYQTNVKGTEHMLTEAVQQGVRRLVLVSSVAVHRYTGFRNADSRKLPVDGDVNAYARSKVLAEALVREATDIETVIVRPGLWPFGPRDPNFNRQARAIQLGLRPLIGGGHAVINTAYSENLVYGLRLAGENPQAAGKSYLIADEGMPSWRELVTELARLLNAPKPRLSLPSGAALGIGKAVEAGWSRVLPGLEPPLTHYLAYVSAADIHFSLAHAKQELGYEPRVSWQEGLRRSVMASGVKSSVL